MKKQIRLGIRYRTARVNACAVRSSRGGDINADPRVRSNTARTTNNKRKKADAQQIGSKMSFLLLKNEIPNGIAAIPARIARRRYKNESVISNDPPDGNSTLAAALCWMPKIDSTRPRYFLSHDMGNVACFEKQLKSDGDNITPYQTISPYPIEQRIAEAHLQNVSSGVND